MSTANWFTLNPLTFGSDIANLQSQINSLDCRLDTLESTVQSLDGRLDTLETSVNNINTTLTSINTTLKNLTNIVNNISTTLVSLGNRVTNIENNGSLPSSLNEPIPINALSTIIDLAGVSWVDLSDPLNTGTIQVGVVRFFRTFKFTGNAADIRFYLIVIRFLTINNPPNAFRFGFQFSPGEEINTTSGQVNQLNTLPTNFTMVTIQGNYTCTVDIDSGQPYISFRCNKNVTDIVNDSCWFYISAI
jgi:uncharacterized coiled-coil protein SlyX